MNEKLSSSWVWLKRYLSVPTLVCLLLLGYIIFSGDSTVFTTIDYDRQIDGLRAELTAQTDTMLYYRDLNSRLSTDPELMERVVREQYGMKRACEDVFIFQTSQK